MYNRVSAAAALRGASTLVAVVAAGVALASPGSVSAAPLLDRVYAFCAQTNCADGEWPSGPLVGDDKGHIFGTTTGGGGDLHDGVVFELSPKTGGGWKYEVICSFGDSKCPEWTNGDLVVDSKGNLYGTTTFGGANQQGTVFELKHGRTGWTYSVLYSFGSAADHSDGVRPIAGLTYAGQSSRNAYDGTSPLFGVSSDDDHGNGSVFELVRNGSKWTQTVIHKFDQGSVHNPLAMDAAGNLYGWMFSATTYQDAFFRLAHDTWKFAVFHQFCQQANCTDGRYPVGRPVIYPDGTIYGVTWFGGANDKGTLFSLTPARHGYEYEVVYSFCYVATHCTDGVLPLGLTMDPTNGSLVGTTSDYLINESSWIPATIFRYRGRKGESVLYTFCHLDGSNKCPNGAVPRDGVIIDSSGKIFGSAEEGGNAKNGGVVYELFP